MQGIFGKSKVNDMQFALNTLSVKNNVVSRNIANSDTPKYKSTKIVFSEVMQEYFSDDKQTMALNRTNKSHIALGGEDLDPRTMVRFQNNPSLRDDGNDVNMDFEMSEQAATDIRYQMFAELIGKKFTGLKDVIKTN